MSPKTPLIKPAMIAARRRPSDTLAGCATPTSPQGRDGVTATRAPVALVPTDRPPRITAVCADGEHSTCIGTVYLWPPPETSPYLVRCECPVCRHEVSAAYRSE